MRFRRLAVLAVSVLLITVACGDDGGDDATPAAPPGATPGTDQTSQIAAGLVENLGVPEDRADCVAITLVAGNFSDAAVDAMTDASKEFPPDEAQAFAEALQNGVVACSGGLPGEISALLVKNLGIAKPNADCLANRLVADDFSNQALKAMADETLTFPAGEAQRFAEAIQSGLVVCSGGPTAQISASLVKSLGIAKKTADCVAERLVARDFSDEALQAMADDTLEFPAAEADAFAKELGEGVVACR